MKKPVKKLKDVVLVRRADGRVWWANHLYEGDELVKPIRICPESVWRDNGADMHLVHQIMNRNPDELSETAEAQLDAAFLDEFLEPPYLEPPY